MGTYIEVFVCCFQRYYGYMLQWWGVTYIYIYCDLVTVCHREFGGGGGGGPFQIFKGCFCLVCFLFGLLCTVRGVGDSFCCVRNQDTS